jgi:ribosomal protein S12 methylthiotransferase
MRYFLDPFGCAKNQVDAEIMMLSLNNALWISVDNPSSADLIIVNSCGFIEKAKRESINAVIAWKKRYPEKKILLAGCLTERYRVELEESLTEADGFLGCNELDCAPEKAAKFFSSKTAELKKAGFSASRTVQPECGSGLRPLLGFPGSAYVKISEGCSNNCSFCAIPLIRGPLRCRPVSGIVEECRQLLERGVKELCLIGQDLASYHSLADLLNSILALHGDFWVRLLYLHPDHFPLDILDNIANDRRVLPYFDIPFQHASPRILSLMGRKGETKSYLRLLKSIRAKLPDAVIRSTFLVGFPGETEDDFNMLLDFQRQACFDWLGVFVFSREEGTAAYSMKGRVAKKTAAKRKLFIEEKQIPITEEKINRFIGRTMDVLVEESVDTLWLGRLFCQAPEVDGATVIRRSDIKTDTQITAKTAPGDMIRGTVVARVGFDLEVLYGI